MEESEGREIWFLNRDLLVVRPREPFVEWAASVFDDAQVSPETTRDWANAFLLPEFDTEEEALAWLSDECEVIFEVMLSEWIVVPEMWPEDRGWGAFQRWFALERIETTWDLVDEPLSSDPPLPERERPLWDA